MSFVPPCGRISRRNLLVDCGMGFAGLALTAMLRRDGLLNARGNAVSRNLASAGRKAAFRAEGEECNLAVHAGRHESPGKLRSEARVKQICGKDHRRHAI